MVKKNKNMIHMIVLFILYIICSEQITTITSSSPPQAIQVLNNGEMYLYQSYFDVSFQNINVVQNLTINGDLYIEKEKSFFINNILINTNANELNYLSTTEVSRDSHLSTINSVEK